MRQLVCMMKFRLPARAGAMSAALALLACGGTNNSAAPEEGSAASGGEQTAQATSQDAPPSGEFKLNKSEGGAGSSSTPASKIKGNAKEAAMKFVVVDKDKGPIPGIVIALTAPDGSKYYTEETSAEGYAEVLVPIGKKYDLVYLALGRKDIAASVPVSDEPNQNIKLTLRYKRFTPPPRPAPTPGVPAEPAPPAGFILDAVTFDTGKDTIRDASFPQLDGVAEYLVHKKSARIEISGHTDNVGKPKVNKQLSEKRAQACRDYLVTQGVEPERIEAVGYGDERPIAPNDSEEGRQKNRRIEAVEL